MLWMRLFQRPGTNSCMQLNTSHTYRQHQHDGLWQLAYAATATFYFLLGCIYFWLIWGLQPNRSRVASSYQNRSSLWEFAKLCLELAAPSPSFQVSFLWAFRDSSKSPCNLLRGGVPKMLSRALCKPVERQTQSTCTRGLKQSYKVNGEVRDVHSLPCFHHSTYPCSSEIFCNSLREIRKPTKFMHSVQLALPYVTMPTGPCPPYQLQQQLSWKKGMRSLQLAQQLCLLKNHFNFFCPLFLIVRYGPCKCTRFTYENANGYIT